MSNDPAHHLLVDLSRELLSMAQKAQLDAAASGDSYDKGRQFALFEVVSVIKQQAECFGVDVSLLGLDGVDPERDLLAK
jgi:hypothetical protein